MAPHKNTTEVIRRVMLSYGIDLLHSKVHARFYLFYTIIILLFVQLSVFPLLKGKHISTMLIPVLSVGVIAVILVDLTYIYARREQIASLLRKLDSVYSYRDRHTLDEASLTGPINRSHATQVNSLLFAYYSFGCATVIILPLLRWAILNNTVLIYPAEYPWSLSGVGPFVMTYLLQIVCSCTATFSVYLIQTFIIFVTIEFLIEFKRLRYAVKTIHRRSMEETIRRSGHRFSGGGGDEAAIRNLERLLIRTDTYRNVYLDNFVNVCEHHRILVQ